VVGAEGISGRHVQDGSTRGRNLSLCPERATGSSPETFGIDETGGATLLIDAE
jgi:hypothetical protein